MKHFKILLLILTCSQTISAEESFKLTPIVPLNYLVTIELDKLSQDANSELPSDFKYIVAARCTAITFKFSALLLETNPDSAEMFNNYFYQWRDWGEQHLLNNNLTIFNNSQARNEMMDLSLEWLERYHSYLGIYINNQNDNSYDFVAIVIEDDSSLCSNQKFYKDFYEKDLN
jgi:hypothetical protein